jgi:hypothetical protein
MSMLSLGRTTAAPKLELKTLGPIVWGAAEIYAQLYPWVPSAEAKQKATDFFKEDGEITKMLVCNICKSHYNEHARNNFPNVESRETLIKWVLNAHNQVNKRNGKSQWTYNQVNESYWGKGWRHFFRNSQDLENYQGVKEDPNLISNELKNTKHSITTSIESYSSLFVFLLVIAIIFMFTLFYKSTKKKK